MAYKTLTPDQLKAAKAWVHDVLVVAGVIQSQRPAGLNAFLLDKYNYNYYYQTFNKYCTEISNEILNASFTNIDSSLNTMSSYRFNPDLAATTNYRKGIKKQPQMLANYIASFCATEGFYWDDTTRTPYELEEFKKTYLGKALEEFGCYVSQPDATKRARTATATNGATLASSTNSNNSTPAASAGQPKNNYKSTGPQSGNVRDLKSVPNQKEYLKGIIFGIEGTNTNAQKVGGFAHIKPLSATGASGNTNKVFLGSANGYTDCKVYLGDLALADDFLLKCQANCPSNITNLHVVKKSVDKNGYFKVGTEYGDVYIAAQKLNEALETEIDDTEVAAHAAWEAYVAEAKAFDTNLHRYN